MIRVPQCNMCGCRQMYVYGWFREGESLWWRCANEEYCGGTRKTEIGYLAPREFLLLVLVPTRRADSINPALLPEIERMETEGLTLFSQSCKYWMLTEDGRGASLELMGAQ